MLKDSDYDVVYMEILQISENGYSEVISLKIFPEKVMEGIRGINLFIRLWRIWFYMYKSFKEILLYQIYFLFARLLENMKMLFLLLMYLSAYLLGWLVYFVLGYIVQNIFGDDGLVWLWNHYWMTHKICLNIVKKK